MKQIPKLQTAFQPIYHYDAEWVKEAKQKANEEERQYQAEISTPYQQMPNYNGTDEEFEKATSDFYKSKKLHSRAEAHSNIQKEQSVYNQFS